MFKFVTRLAAIALFAATAFSANADTGREDFRLLALNLQEPSFTVQVSSTGPSAAKLRVGDKVTFHLSGIDGGSVYAINLDSAGAVTLLFPNQFEGRDQKNGNTLQIPGAAAKYVLEVVGKPGSEIVKFFVLKGDTKAFENVLKNSFAMNEAFPRGIKPIATTVNSLDDYLKNPHGTVVRIATVEYEIVH